jgi:carbonic anhydrase
VSVIDEVLEANREYSVEHDPDKVSPRPTRKLAILTCMDTRIGRKTLGLAPGDAHIIRNAGGIVTDDAIRSLLLSHYVLGTQEIMVINHTDCGLMKASERELKEMMEEKTGVPANSKIRFHAFTDVERNVREQLERLHAHSWITKEMTIRGFVYDVRTGHLKEITR